MPTRNVVLSDHQSKLVETLVASGRYQNASEVLREGLRLVELRERQDSARLEALRSAVQVGFDALDRGDYIDFEKIEDFKLYIHDLAEEEIVSVETAEG